MRKSNYKNGSSEQKSAQERALDRFAEMMIEKIESISRDWHKPWFCNTGDYWPRNLDGRYYNGMNSMMLMWHSENKGYKYPIFVTLKRVTNLNFKKNPDGTSSQATDKDGKPLPRVAITKGEKSFPVFITTFTVIDPNGNKMKIEDYRLLSRDDQEQCKVFPSNQVYNVFNIEQTNLKESRPDLYDKLTGQCDGKAPVNKDNFHFEPIDKMIIDNLWFCPIKPTYGDNAYFSLTKDEIVIPTYSQFSDGESYYSNLFHEMAHSTGHKDRLNRLQKATFGSDEYAKEELVAELTAALVAQMYGMSKHITDDSAAYLKSWLKSLREDASFINSVLVHVKHAASMINKKIDEVSDTIAKLNEDVSSSLIKQYNDMKQKHPDAILLFRCGDFYEIFHDDATQASTILGLTLNTTKYGKRSVGFPHYALDTYLPKLIRAGKRVAICDKLTA